MHRAFLALLVGFPLAAANWNSVKTGPFIVYSQFPPKTTREAAAVLEQFRFSLGELLGRHDLAVHPQLQLFLVSEPVAQTGLITTRTGAVAIRQSASAVSLETLSTLGRLLLDQNVGRMPPALEEGLAQFLSTTEVKGAHVIWGAPPPHPSPTWALIDWLVTNPDTYGKVRVLLGNLENNVDESVAYRNSIGKSPADVAREVDAFRASGHFPTIDAPSRPLSPERDFVLRQVEPDDLELHLADLLDAQSEMRYRALLNAGKFKVECQEGLALIALGRKDVTSAADLLKQAIDGGSKNAAAMLQYARIEPDPAKSMDILQKALEIDPNSAEAHFLLGERLTDPVKQVEQWSIATKLAPRNEDNWVRYAQALVAMRQWGPAAKAYQGAEQAATTPDDREKMMQARLAIEGQRLDFEDAEKRQQEQARQQEIDRLKTQAIAQIRAAEAKANGGVSTTDAAKGAVDWSDLHTPNAKAEGQLIHVACDGTHLTLTVRVSAAKSVKLEADQSTLSITGPGHPVLSCEDVAARRVSVAYVSQRNVHDGTSGEAVSIDFR